MRFLIALFALVLVVGSGGVALADDREEARRAFAEGQAADKRGAYAEAIEHYQRAYDLVPHHFALYNIGTDYERLGQLREAVRWFERYLEIAPASASADREKVQAVIIQLKLRPSKLTVTSRPNGARVLIDNQPVGVTPYVKSIRGGGHRITVELGGQRDERDIVLEYGEPRAVEFTLRNVPAEKPPGVVGTGTGATIEVRGTPVGALVAIDDQVVGSVPASVPVSPGQHTVKVTSFGYTPYDTTVTVSENATEGVDVALQPGGATGTTPNVINVGYLIAGGAGVELRSPGTISLFDFGLRASQYDAAIRVGKASGYTAVDFLVRWAVLKTKISPYIGIGYSYAVGGSDDAGDTTTTGGSGWTLVGGLRWDLVRGSMAGISLVAESGLRYYAGLSSTNINTGMSTPGPSVMIPLMVSVQIVYGKLNK